jgi:hypothetical protein
MSLSGIPRPAEAVAARALALKRLSPALMTGAEARGTPSCRVANRELGNRSDGRRLAFAGKRRANQRPMHRALVFAISAIVVFSSVVSALIALGVERDGSRNVLAFVDYRSTLMLRRRLHHLLIVMLVGLLAPHLHRR